MLVLSRRANERIRIGENIVITVLRTGYDKVRIGIDAPKEVPVVRTELDEQTVDTRPDAR